MKAVVLANKKCRRILAVFLAALCVLGTLSLRTLPVLAAESREPLLRYASHSQTYGWGGQVNNGETSGTVGKGKRLEAITMSLDLDGTGLTGGIRYRVHAQTYGWMNWVEGDNQGASAWQMIEENRYAGTMGQGKRLEAIRIELTGEVAEKYDILYRVHGQTYGWTSWVKNGEKAGTTGQGKRLEAIEIKLLEKPKQVKASLSYRVHCQTYGWMDTVAEGETAGTVGRGKRLEAIQLNLNCDGVTGGIEYSAHCQSYGWMKPVSNGATAGVTGQKKRMEAIKISLTGDVSAYYDVYYRVHCQSKGWMDWAKNGSPAGTEGHGYRMEAIEVRLVSKGSPAPGLTDYPFDKFKGPTKDTYVIKVNRQACCVTVYRAGTPIKAMACSPGEDTPTGTYHIMNQWRWHELMGGVKGQYTSQIVGGILFHSVLYDDYNVRTLQASSYNNLGKRVSHGCVRLRVADAKWIFDNCPVGTTVIIYNSPDPGPLGKPTYDPIPSGQRYDPSDPNL